MQLELFHMFYGRVNRYLLLKKATMGKKMITDKKKTCNYAKNCVSHLNDLHLILVIPLTFKVILPNARIINVLLLQ